MSALTKLSTRGRVTIPKEIRDRLGFVAGVKLDVIVENGEIFLRKQAPSEQSTR